MTTTDVPAAFSGLGPTEAPPNTQFQTARGDEHRREVQTTPFVVQRLPPMTAPLRFGCVAQSPEKRIIDPTGHNDAQTAAANGPRYQSIFRGSLPRSRHLPFLARLKIRTIVSLTPMPIESIDQGVAQWCQASQVTMHHLRCEKPKEDGGGLTRDVAAKALTIILDKRNLPLYIHCLDGQIITTLLVAIVRKVQAWSTAAIQSEMSRWLGYDEELLSYQVSFMDKFGKPDGVRLPPRRFIPDWTWPEASPLRRLRDPYDVITPKEKLERPSTSSNSSVATEAATTSNGHKRHSSIDAPSTASSSTTGGHHSSVPPFAHRSTGSLPVQHPTLKLKFDVDLELPPPPSLPLSPLGAPAATPPLGHSRDSSVLLSPSPSRPTSRSGRSQNQFGPSHTHAQSGHNQSNADAGSRASSRASSRPDSPMRKRTAAGSSDAQSTTIQANASDATWRSGETESSKSSSPDLFIGSKEGQDGQSHASPIKHPNAPSTRSPRLDTDYSLPAPLYRSTSGQMGTPTHYLHTNDYQHQPHVHSRLNDVFYSSASRSATPRASSSQHRTNGSSQAQQNHPTAGLGLRENGPSSLVPMSLNSNSSTASLPATQPVASWRASELQGIRHPSMFRSVSDQAVPASSEKDQEEYGSRQHQPLSVLQSLSNLGDGNSHHGIGAMGREGNGLYEESVLENLSTAESSELDRDEFDSVEHGSSTAWKRGDSTESVRGLLLERKIEGETEQEPDHLEANHELERRHSQDHDELEEMEDEEEQEEQEEEQEEEEEEEEEDDEKDKDKDLGEESESDNESSSSDLALEALDLEGY